MCKYNTLAIKGNFDYMAMPDAIQKLVRDIFNPDHLEGTIGHWEENKHLALSRGISLSVFSRLGHNCISEWEWEGNSHWSQTLEKGLDLQSLSVGKMSRQELRALIDILAPYSEQGEVFALIGHYNDSGFFIDSFSHSDNGLFITRKPAANFMSCNPFEQSELWTVPGDLKCQSL